MGSENRCDSARISSADEVMEHPAGEPPTGTSREGLDVESTQIENGAEASFTFAQIEAACNTLRAYGAECITADQYGVGDPSEIDFIKEIVVALGLGL